MRPFRELSEAALHRDSVQTAQRVLELLLAFEAVMPATASGMRVEVYRRELHTLLEELARDERRLEALADELLLREHWRALRSERRSSPPR